MLAWLPRARFDGRVDQVAQHGAGRRETARAAAVEHEVAHGRALDEHRVEAVAHGGQRMLSRHHRGVHTHAHLIAFRPVPLLGDGQQLDDVAHLGGVVDVGPGDVGDALVGHVAGHHSHAEGDRGDDRGLGGGVVALDVGGGIALGVAQALRFAQGVGVGGAALGHAREDVVGRPVDDPHDPVDALAGERLPQRPDHGDSAADRGLEQQVDAGVVGRCEQLGAHIGEQLLVGGDDRLAGFDRVERQLPGRLDPADDLHDHVDAGVRHHAGRVVGEHPVRQGHRALLGDAAHGDARHLEREPRAGGDVVGPGADQLDERRPHVAAAEEAHADGLKGHGRSS